MPCRYDRASAAQTSSSFVTPLAESSSVSACGRWHWEVRVQLSVILWRLKHDEVRVPQNGRFSSESRFKNKYVWYCGFDLTFWYLWKHPSLAHHPWPTNLRSKFHLPWDSLALRHINFSICLLTCPAVWSKFTNLASWKKAWFQYRWRHHQHHPTSPPARCLHWAKVWRIPGRKIDL